MAIKMKESDLAAKLIEYLSTEPCDIYQEVDSPCGSADIVLKYPSFTWAIECKLSFNFTVLAQAEANLRYFNYSSICVKQPGTGIKNWNFGSKLCRVLGIGIFITGETTTTREHLKAKLQRSALTNKVNLYPDKKDFAKAGNPDGLRWTPFKQTVEHLEKFIKKNPGCKMKEALTHITHHYASISSAQSSLAGLIKSGVIKNIINENGTLRLNNNGTLRLNE